MQTRTIVGGAIGSFAPQVWFPFIECIESKKGKKTEGLKAVAPCALRHNIDHDKMKKCALSDEGEKLLLAQKARTPVHLRSGARAHAWCMQAKEDKFLALPSTKKFVKDEAKDDFKGAVKTAFDALGKNDDAVAEMEKVFAAEISKLKEHIYCTDHPAARVCAHHQSSSSAAQEPEEEKETRSFMPYVPLFTITTNGHQRIVKLHGKNVSAITARGLWINVSLYCALS